MYSQIRKGAPLHVEWHQAFADERFHQRQGRASLPNEGAVATPVVLKMADVRAAPSRVSARQAQAPPPVASSMMTYWVDPTFAEKETLDLFNNEADVMGTDPNGATCSPFDGFQEITSGGDFLQSLLPTKKRSAPDDERDGYRARQRQEVEQVGAATTDDLYEFVLGAFP